MLHTHILGRNHLAVEHHILTAVLLVVLLNQSENTLNEMHIVVVRCDFQSHELSSLYQAVDTNGQVLTVDIDITGIEQRQHTMCLQVFQVFVVGQLHLMAQVDHLAKIGQIIHLMVDGILHTTVQVDGQHTLGTSRHATSTQCIAESIVSDLITQTAARAERIGIITHIGEERVTLSIHLGSELTPLLVLALTIAIGQQCHGLNRERQQGLGALFVEPLHETLLQPGETLPVGLGPIGEVEVAEDTLKIVTVIVSHIPEHCLIVACTSRLIQRVDDLLEIVSDNLIDGTLLQREVGLLIGTLIVIQSILLTDEVVHIHQELGGGTGTCQHRAHHEHHIDETASKRLQVGRSGRVTTNTSCTTNQPRIHGNRRTIVGQRGLVVLIYKVVCQQVDILISQFLVVHLLDTLSQQTTVQADEVRLGKLANQGSDILVLHIGIGIKL